ncbi:DUF2790 domain-containing protein [Azotobacter chroococcum]
MKRSYLVLPFCCAASLAQAAEPPVQQYRYGLPLDIARVISIETPYDPYVCRIVDARMTYRTPPAKPRSSPIANYPPAAS